MCVRPVPAAFPTANATMTRRIARVWKDTCLDWAFASRAACRDRARMAGTGGARASAKPRLYCALGIRLRSNYTTNCVCVGGIGMPNVVGMGLFGDRAHGARNSKK
jgi:hypothetical protein